MNNEDVYIKNKIEEYYKNKKNIFDSPFYIINIKDIIKQYTEWKIKLPNIKAYYAIKCNNNDKIIKILNTLGCNFDCASKREIELVKEYTNTTENIIYAHPCKMISHIKYAKNNNVNLMTFDCVEELYKIKEHHETAKLLLRLCVDDSKSLCQFNSKFGCKIDDIEKIFDTIINLKLNLAGFSFHVGSGCKDPYFYYTALKICKNAYTMALNRNIMASIIDIGGGFPGTNDTNISFDDIVYNINKGIKEYFSNSHILFIAEPGRYLVEKSHTLVLSVISKKKEDNVIKYYLNDGIYGSFNCIHYDHQNPTLIPFNNVNIINGINQDDEYNSTFFGPTCDSMDVIYENIPFKELQIGDILYVKNFGAYTVSPSSIFNGYSVTENQYIYI
uniref:ornithine decarboxylase n=1 Tax=viral metagenome TaxID=1070528 RepID=A0A6C0J2Y3_9ZZZZ